MDAICFVLGVKAKSLRGDSLDQLIYHSSKLKTKGEDTPKRVTGKASVTLVMSKRGGKEELFFRRSIKSSEKAVKSSYSFNNKDISFEDYEEKLKEIGVLVRAHNFLVFQGKIDSLVSQENSMELTEMMEEVSGSVEYKKEYERLQEEKEKAEEQTIMNMQKKRGFIAEKKQYKEQKEEAERYQKLVEEQSSTKVNFVLFQLFHIQKQVNALKDNLKTLKKEEESVSKKVGEVEEQLKQSQKEFAKKQSQVGNCEKETRKRKQEILQKNPDLIKNREEMKQIEEKLHSARQKREELKEMKEKEEEENDQLKAMIEELEKKKERKEEELEERSKKIQLTPKQKEAYSKAKQQVESKTSKEKQEVNTLETKAQQLQEQVNDIDTSLSQLLSRKQLLEERETELMERKRKVDVFIGETEKKIQALSLQIDNLNSDSKNSSEKREELVNTLNQVQEEIRNAKSERKESEREKLLSELVEKMKRLFPGVHGRVIDLCKPTQKKYNVALTVALGKNMEAVIVDTKATALECIKYMREQRGGVATFLPLDSIHAPPLKESLRNIENATLVINLIQFPETVRRALQYCLANTLLCEDLENAKEIAFHRQQRLKVVTLEGTLIQKSGIMSGGFSSLSSASRKWDEKEVERLKKRREELLRSLEQIGDSFRRESEKEHLSSQLSSLKNRLSYSTSDNKITEKKLEEIGEQRGEVEEQEKQLKKNREKLSKEKKGVDSEIEEKKESISKVEEELFASFTLQIGVKNIREYEERNEKRREMSEQLVKFADQLSSLKSRVEFNSSRNLSSRIEKMEAFIKEQEEALEKVKKEEKKYKGKENELLKKLEEVKRDCEKKKEELSKVEAEREERKKRVQERVKERGAVQEKVSMCKSELEKLRGKRGDLFKQCQVEQLELFTISSSNEQPTPLSHALSLLPSGEKDPMQLSTEEQSKLWKAQDQIQLDFTPLSKELRRVKWESEEYHSQIQTFTSKLSELATELAKLAPNLKAVERLSTVVDRLKEANESLETAKNATGKADTLFNKLKKKRYEAFMSAFQHVSSVIGDVYKQLTSSKGNPQGGQAYLSLLNAEEPFLHPVRFSAMPPSKRFRDMEQLSGGEKSVAVLSLLFSMQLYNKAPFFVLDEVDSALDSGNVALLANYLRKRSSSNDCQFVVISLKDDVYSLANSLVGVYKDQPNDTSRVLSLHLDAHATN